MDDKKWLSIFNNQSSNALTMVLETNQYTQKFGLQLSKEEALMITEARKSSLVEQERIEFGEGIIHKLIFEFCDSPYIYQDNYVETIITLQDIFYLYKNESLDELTDDELISYMKREFEGVCEGSLEHLEDTSLEKFAREIREGTHRFLSRNEDEGEDEDEL
ncbi:MAG: DUF6323 family protein [Lachnospiraceae bacterium]|nr:DUF6323 family protein [Lachnospiraceae bacterium]